jgi:hypothetical protein
MMMLDTLLVTTIRTGRAIPSMWYTLLVPLLYSKFVQPTVV